MTMIVSGPDSASHLAFLAYLERLLSAGRFTSTYKFALLLSLSNIAVEKGDDSGRPLSVELDDVARQFIALYWNMARPYQRLNLVLKQNREASKPSRMITLIGEQSRHSQSRYRRWREYRGDMQKLVRDTRRTMARDVLYRLQVVGTQQSERSQPFLYDHPPTAAECARLRDIELKPGVAASMRRLHGVIVSMVQARWALWVRENNKRLGPDRNLEEHLFGADRKSVAKYAKRLHALQGGRCFYTDRRLRLIDPRTVEVDHFIPWARYPFDSPFNLVLASRAENNRMRDELKPEACGSSGSSGTRSTSTCWWRRSRRGLGRMRPTARRRRRWRGGCMGVGGRGRNWPENCGKCSRHTRR
jgi:hypothetical protein